MGIAGYLRRNRRGAKGFPETFPEGLALLSKEQKNSGEADRAMDHSMHGG
jgi:hypothetical protein